MANQGHIEGFSCVPEMRWAERPLVKSNEKLAEFSPARPSTRHMLRELSSQNSIKVGWPWTAQSGGAFITKPVYPIFMFCFQDGQFQFLTTKSQLPI